jgi:hypothetical protein
VIILSIDASKSARNYYEWQAQIIRRIAEACGDEFVGLIAYSSRAVPLLDPTKDREKIEEALRGIHPLRGIPEPALAVREAIHSIYSYRRDLPGDDYIIVFWSAPKPPKIPLTFAVQMARAVGAELLFVLMHYVLPRWARNRRVQDIVNILYRRSSTGDSIIRKLGCKEA